MSVMNYPSWVIMPIPSTVQSSYPLTTVQSSYPLTAIQSEPVLINHRIVAQDFFKKYATLSKSGFSATEAFYHQDAAINLSIKQNGYFFQEEMRGFSALRNRLSSLGVTMIDYHTYQINSQLIDAHTLIVIVTGKADVNSSSNFYNYIFVLKLVGQSFFIVNQFVDFLS